jgi:ParB family chromosome partitioning protein
MAKKTFRIKGQLTEAMQDTISSAKNNAGELHIEIIPLRKINLDPTNPRDLALTIEDVYNGLIESDSEFLRKQKEKDNLSSMVKSIVEQGVINPIVVYKLGEQYRLIAGERRTLSSMIAGKTDIPAKVLTTKPDPLKLSLLQWIENIEREDLTLWERMLNLEKILAAYSESKGKSPAQVTATEISQLAGCSLQQGVNYRNVLSASDDLKHHIKTGDIKNIDKAAFIAKSSPAIQARLIQRCVMGATLGELKKVALENTSTHRMDINTTTGAKINLGSTSHPAVAKNIINAILTHKNYQHLSAHLGEVAWNDHQSISSSFKKLLKLLEQTQG